MKTSHSEKFPSGAPSADSATTEAAEAAETADNLATMALFAAQIDSRTRCSRETPITAADCPACGPTVNGPEPPAVDNGTHGTHGTHDVR